MEPGLTILVPARAWAGFWGVWDGGGPIGVGPMEDGPLGGLLGGLLGGGRGGIWTLLPLLL